MKKALREKQTLRAGYSADCLTVTANNFAADCVQSTDAVVVCEATVVRRSQKFSHRRRPPSRGGDGRPKFNQLKTVTIPLPTNPVW